MIYANGTPVDLRKFPNGELDLSHIQNCGHIVLKWESNEDLFNLMLVKRYLDNVPTNTPDVSLTILYMPYSRMDRDKDGGSACSLRFVGEFIQSLNFKSITVIDPHSELTLAYLGTRAKSHFPFETFKIHAFDGIPGIHDDTPVIMFPDAGAQKRYSKEAMFAKNPQVVGYKNRDFATGHILGYDISNAECVRGRPVVIVDDLCSRGTTFLFAAREIRKFDPLSITLLVSHCEDTVFQGELLHPDSPVDFLITTDSMLDPARINRTPLGYGDKIRIIHVD